jgi:hypothetical protein
VDPQVIAPLNALSIVAVRQLSVLADEEPEARRWVPWCTLSLLLVVPLFCWPVIDILIISNHKRLPHVIQRLLLCYKSASET